MFVYILQSELSGKYYCGQTQNLQHRLARHNNGLEKYTKHGVPWKMIYSIHVFDRSEAVQLESKIKKRGIARYLNDINSE